MMTGKRKRLIFVMALAVSSMLLLSGCGLGKMAREHQASQGGPVELKLAYHCRRIIICRRGWSGLRSGLMSVQAVR